MGVLHLILHRLQGGRMQQRLEEMLPSLPENDCACACGRKQKVARRINWVRVGNGQKAGLLVRAI